jgi:putative glutamine amidotransferase
VISPQWTARNDRGQARARSLEPDTVDSREYRMLAIGRYRFPCNAPILSRMKPLIGVTTSELRPGELATLRRHGEPPHAEMALGITYVRAIEAAGGVPVLMPPLAPEHVPALVARLDGLLLSGGPDLAPEAYDARPHAELGATEPGLDVFEYALIREALHDGLPILGICRGAQALNVACGGTLHQHLPNVLGDTILHRQSEDGRYPTHFVDVLPGSRLAHVLGTKRLRVNSFHHQAVDRLGIGLRVCARAPDGTIEAIEDPARPLVAAVQWHAETLIDGPAHRALFEELVAVAAGVRQLPRAA